MPIEHIANLGKTTAFSVDVVIIDTYTPFIQISNANQQVLQTIPIDPTDHTVTGVISSTALASLDDERKEELLDLLGRKLPVDLGTKQFLNVDAKWTVPNYILPKDRAGNRVRNATRTILLEDTSSILDAHPDLVQQLDTDYQFVLGDDVLALAEKNPQEFYTKVSDLLAQANFTEAKQQEYKTEDLQGKASRFNNKAVTPLIMQDTTDGKFVAMIRAVSSSENTVYLSDEVILEKLVLIERFAGATKEEQSKNQQQFLLAYLMNKTGQLLPQKEMLTIIAANNRVDIYESLGFGKFSFSEVGRKDLISFTPTVGPVMEELKRRISELTFSVVSESRVKAGPVFASS